jgi:hypothetical protein
VFIPRGASSILQFGNRFVARQKIAVLFGVTFIFDHKHAASRITPIAIYHVRFLGGG